VLSSSGLSISSCLPAFVSRLFEIISLIVYRLLLTRISHKEISFMMTMLERRSSLLQSIIFARRDPPSGLHTDIRVWDFLSH